jgi:hypothetical protein
LRDITPCSLLISSSDVSEEHIASIFRVQEYAKQRNQREAGSKLGSA